MARLVRDLAHKSDKEIQLNTQGEETELDRTVVDKIADPLVHMIRNSVDHGIESKEDRQKAGKPDAGTIQLRAFHKAGHVIIEVEDDGKGLDKDRIIQKAIDQGLLQKGQEISDDDAYRLVFHAGLSTAQKVTDISGRGVGMDVVKKSVEELQGKIDIATRPGQGTTFTIRLPLTLAIIDGQIVTVGPERYIVPVNSIVNSFRPTAGQISSVQGQGEVVSIRGELLPLVRLHRLFGVTARSNDPTQGLLMIVEADARRCCVLVDELLGQQQVVIKNLGEGLGLVRGIAGGAIMGDGRVSLIVDVPGLIDLSRS
jgi:two-component system chemotaxis sensor kinase CheA